MLSETLTPSVKKFNFGKSSLVVWAFLFLSLILLLAIFYLILKVPVSMRMTDITTVLGLSILAHTFIISPLGYIAGLLLGLIDLFNNQQKKTVSVLGIALNSGFLLLLITLNVLFIRATIEFGKHLD